MDVFFLSLQDLFAIRYHFATWLVQALSHAQIFLQMFGDPWQCSFFKVRHFKNLTESSMCTVWFRQLVDFCVGMATFSLEELLSIRILWLFSFGRYVFSERNSWGYKPESWDCGSQVSKMTRSQTVHWEDLDRLCFQCRPSSPGCLWSLKSHGILNLCVPSKM